jgi:sulfur carrier protein
MKIMVNGKEQQTEAKTIAELIAQLGYEGDYFAVAQNLRVVQRARYAEMPINENDEIEILMPMQGG